MHRTVYKSSQLSVQSIHPNAMRDMTASNRANLLLRPLYMCFQYTAPPPSLPRQHSRAVVGRETAMACRILPLLVGER